MSTVEREMQEIDAKRVAKRPELARQVRNRGNKQADGGIHAVKRERGINRKQEAAEVTEVDRGPVKRWQRADALPTLPDLPGFHVGYIRRDNQQRGDHENLLAHISEGWEFCRKTDFPKKFLPTQRLTEYGEVIGNASVIAMKIPDELFAQRNAYYNGQRDKTTRAISRPDPTLGGVGHKHMPIVEDKSTTSETINRARARRAPVRVADDV